MKKLFFIASWSVILSACTSGGGESTMKATIKNLEDSEILVRVSGIGDYKKLLDTTISCTNGKFSFNNRFSDPISVVFMPKSGLRDTTETNVFKGRNTMMIELYMLKGEHYTIKGSVNENVLLLSAEGSEMNTVQTDLRTKYIDVQKYSDMMGDEGIQQRDIDSIRKLTEKLRENMTAEKLEYVKTHPDSQLSGLFLSEQNTDNFDIYYPQISESVKTGFFKNRIKMAKNKSDLIVNSKKVKAGVQSIDFTLSELDGETVTLSSLRGKYVLLYFWGSW